MLNNMKKNLELEACKFKRTNLTALKGNLHSTGYLLTLSKTPFRELINVVAPLHLQSLRLTANALSKI